ncbi:MULTISPECIES: phenolic acid decarboxylase [Commensalibacter]|uniref:Phenolic acid decarboxylase n=2 Tax=Commensalibacter TaxID=1079922 RepID=W7DTH8_9PROT|nr:MULTISPECIES: phenolic acid decarboxylase [Commensalibacter]EUK18225.1 phenolic acid decarboxylase [Commensalibacter papalotli (ex Servin-Garciduenas et al. 2014)]CAI3937342.1 Phenolic acid decarboxylase (PadC) (PDB:2GC9) [Commensalibacter papalotli (ex Botero et al. 2024)]CAI3938290.1 Phenolic acid decarboxylase (PadC) (PDB:2GC9) [Commensalibacter papalotli (ex Botero et al. 2024)]
MSTFDRKDLSYFLGKQLMFTYDNGWNYELYIKNEQLVDYRIHYGIVGQKWVKNQPVSIARIGEEICKISWTEPTGINVGIVINLQDNFYQGTIFFPRWVINHPERCKGFQNDQIALMEFYREAGPTYPIEIIDEFANITFIKDRGINNESVIACAASELPADFPHNLNL